MASMTQKKHSGYHILLAYHNCVSSDLTVTLYHTIILLNSKNKMKLEAKKTLLLWNALAALNIKAFFLSTYLNPFQWQ